MKKRKSTFSVKNSIKKDQERSSGGFGYLKLPDGIELFKPEPGGRATLDFMLYEVTTDDHPDFDAELESAEKGGLHWRLPFSVHKNIGANKETVVCPSTFGNPCPICDYFQQQLREGVDYDDLAEIKKSDRTLYVVIPIGMKDFEKKPHLWDMSFWLFGKLLNEELDENQDAQCFPDITEGLSVKIRFDEKTFGKNKYAEASRIDFEERDEEYTEDILEKIPHLDDVLVVKSYKQLESMFLTGEEEEEEQEEEIPKQSKRKGKITGKQLEEEEEEEEEINKPKKKRSTASRKKETTIICPIEGLILGEDTDQYEECDDCPKEIYKACRQKNKENG